MTNTFVGRLLGTIIALAAVWVIAYGALPMPHFPARVDDDDDAAAADGLLVFVSIRRIVVG